MNQAPSASAWAGPSAKKMIETRTLHTNIIQRHGGPEPIFDDAEMARLRSFVNKPEHSKALLAEFDMQDVVGDTPGTSAQRQGSLAGYIIATHGTDAAVLVDDDISVLKDWFGNVDGKRSRDV